MWRFLRSEMKVILSLVEDATRTDAEVAEIYGMNAGTVASVRRRLIDAGAVYYVNIPSFNRLGCEMVGFHLGVTDPAISSDTKTSHYIEFCAKAPQVFDAIIGGNSLSMYTVFKDASEMDRFIQFHKQFFSGQRRASRAKLDTTAFPYSVTKGSYSTNFAPLVRNFFNIDVPPPAARAPESVEVEDVDLTENERNVLVSLVEHPEYSDRKLSSVVDLSRQAVTRIRHRLQDMDLYRPVCVPRLYKWGFEIFIVAHAHFSMDLDWDSRTKSQPTETDRYSYFSLVKANESVGNYMVASFQDYVQKLDSVTGWYHRAKAFDGPPEITLFSLEQCVELKTFEFGATLRHVLGMKPLSK